MGNASSAGDPCLEARLLTLVMVVGAEKKAADDDGPSAVEVADSSNLKRQPRLISFLITVLYL